MSDTPTSEDFPRQQAITHRFRLGLPRAFRIAPDGMRVAFVRSDSGRDAVGSLWVLTAEGERRVVDARALDRGADLPAAERARRERLRETTSGITTYSADAGVTRAVFALDGAPVAVDLIDPSAMPVVLPHPGPVVDPRMAPDGSLATAVVDGSLVLLDPTGGPARTLCAREGEDQAWGLADFVAAEELDRSRGAWWLADSHALLVEHVDESGVDIRWISDPAHPENAPRPHRYPSAGTANPQARLFLVTTTGERHELLWDREAYPYLATVHVGVAGDPSAAVVSVLSRDQTRQRVFDVVDARPTDLAAGRTPHLQPIHERVCEPWITLIDGVPWRDGQGRLLEVLPHEGAFALHVDGRPMSPVDLQVTGVLHADAARIVVSAQPDPREEHLYSVSATGEVTALTEGPSTDGAVVEDGGMVLVRTDDRTCTPTYEARTSAFTAPLTSRAETPTVAPRLTTALVTERRLPAALLLPHDHVAGTALPVVMAPYGGPHHSRVRHGAGAFAGDQWLADQGFAVVVVDGAGTPGRGPAVEHEVAHDLASRVLQDQVEGLRAVAEQNPDLDLSRVGITGWSFGGYLAALAVLDRPDVFHAAVAGAPVTDWALYDTAYTERYLGTPQDHPEAYAQTSLLARAASLTRPLLIIHGLADDNVLAAHSLQLSGALLAAGRPHTFLPLAGVTHMTPQVAVAENLLRLEADFLRRHLQG